MAKFVLLFLLLLAGGYWLFHIARKSDRKKVGRTLARLVVPAVMALAVVSALLLINLNTSIKVV